MLASETKLLSDLRAFSRYCISFGILASSLFMLFGGMPIGWQVVLTMIALAVGIPHGAVDHLITVPKIASLKMALFLTGYLAVVGLAIWAILSANLLGFQLVVLMSAIHFGLGDAAFVSELDARHGQRPALPKFLFASASGFTPVLIPLVSSESSAALAAVNPALIDWSGGLAPLLFTVMVVFTASATLWMLLKRRLDAAIDLGLLLTLALVAPPLVAFAFYFGLWHALRHTGRVSLELSAARAKHEAGEDKGALWVAIRAGLPALLAVLVFTVALGFTMGFNLSQDLLWYLLVVIWALTVPHMALTLRLDVRALGRA